MLMHSLPKPLLELILTQSRSLVSHRTFAFRSYVATRLNHTSATIPSPNALSQSFDWGVFSIKPDNAEAGTSSGRQIASVSNEGPMELEKKLEALKSVIEKEDTQSLERDQESIPDEQLQSIYKDILSLPDAGTSNNELIEETEVLELVQIPRSELIPLLFHRLIDSASLAPDVHALASEQSSDADHKAVIPSILTAIETSVSGIEAMRKVVRVSTGRQRTSVPLVVLSQSEWRSLVTACVEMEAFEEAERTIWFITRLEGKTSNLREDLIGSVLASYSCRGDIERAKSLVERYCPDLSVVSHRDLLLQAHLTSGQVGPAITLLHELEEKGTPASVPGYTSIINRLVFARKGDNVNVSSHSDDSISSVTEISTSRPSYTRLHARAWDLFAHMRYVAHPIPDLPLYTLMISLCGLNPIGRVEPERALDLWYEMVHQSHLTPNTAAYNALLLVLARASGSSGEGEKWAFEAWRVAREMMDSARDGEGKMYDSMRPDAVTFERLLEVCKRSGDLGRCRWVIREMARWSGGMGGVSDKAMVHVFHCYAKYKPPSGRIPVLRKVDVEETKYEPNVERTEAVEVESERQATNDDLFRTPSSRIEVLQEVDALLEGVIQSNSNSSEDSPSDSTPKRTPIPLTPELVTAYLAVHGKHNQRLWAGDSTSFPKIWDATWERLACLPQKVLKVTKSFVIAMDWSARRPIKSSPADKDDLMMWSNTLWEEWRKYEDRFFSLAGRMTSGDARRVERIWSARIRMLALNDKLSEAVGTVMAFLARYPPSLLQARGHGAGEVYDSTRAILASPTGRPIVRLSTPHEIGDDTIPPMLTFRDVETLHHRLVLEEDTRSIRKLSWVIRSYDQRLKQKRRETLGIDSGDRGRGAMVVVANVKDVPRARDDVRRLRS